MLALIDEWGNPVPGSRGTEWFGFAAAMIPDSQVDDVFDLLRDIRRTQSPTPPHSIHFRNIKSESKYHIIHRYSQAGINISFVCVKVSLVHSQHLQRMGYAYRYYGREIVRIVTHFAHHIDETVNIVFDQHEYLVTIPKRVAKSLGVVERES